MFLKDNEQNESGQEIQLKCFYEKKELELSIVKYIIDDNKLIELYKTNFLFFITFRVVQNQEKKRRSIEIDK